MSPLGGPFALVLASCAALAVLLGAPWIGIANPLTVESDAAVDVALIVAVDVSQSVDEQRYRLQMEGIAQALEDPGVLSSITSGTHGTILFTMIAWADGAKQILDWQRITSKNDADALATRVRQLPHSGGEFTCMARMLRTVALHLIPNIPVKAQRIVLDVSGDGADNCSDRDALHEERDRVISLAATINGLPIIVPGENDMVGAGAYRAPGFGLRQLSPRPDTDATTLDQWYNNHVIGGPGAFLLAAHGYGDFGRALRQKFVTEISSNVTCRTVECRVASCSQACGGVLPLYRFQTRICGFERPSTSIRGMQRFGTNVAPSGLDVSRRSGGALVPTGKC